MNAETINALKEVYHNYEINKDLYLKMENLPVPPRRLAAYRDRVEGNLYEIREGVFTGIRGIPKPWIDELEATENFLNACEFSIHENSHGYVTVETTIPWWQWEETSCEIAVNGYYVWFNGRDQDGEIYIDAKYFKEDALVVLRY